MTYPEPPSSAMSHTTAPVAGAVASQPSAVEPSSHIPSGPQPPQGYAAPPEPRQAHPPHRSRSSVIFMIIGIVALLIALVVGAGSCASRVFMADSYDSAPQNAIAEIAINGTIGYDGSSSSPKGLKELLDKAKENDNIKAVVLRVNSGGGISTAGEEMARYVKEFSEHKPIVVSSASINCSAAYEISSQSDYIFVNRTTEIGSIGTVMQLLDYSQLMELLGVKSEAITSAPNKDSSFGTRPLTDDERAYYQDIVDEINDVFIETVAEGRNMSRDDVEELATGLPFTGMTAIDNGLADEVGSQEDAVQKAADLAGVGDDYHAFSLSLPEQGLSGLLGALSSEGLTHEDIAFALAEMAKELKDYDGSVR